MTLDSIERWLRCQASTAELEALLDLIAALRGSEQALHVVNLSMPEKLTRREPVNDQPELKL